LAVKKRVFILSLLVMMCGCSFVNTPPDPISDLLDRVEKLNIGRNGYILGKPLTDDQKELARRQSVAIENPDLIKFNEKNLFVVAERKTQRPVILYEQHETVNREKLREIVGELFLDFGEPTVFTHDKVIYWAYGKEKKIPETVYRKAKEEKQKFEILATVKLTSDLKITKKAEVNTDGTKGSVYYIISSPPVLKAITSKGSSSESQ